MKNLDNNLGLFISLAICCLLYKNGRSNQIILTICSFEAFLVYINKSNFLLELNEKFFLFFFFSFQKENERILKRNYTVKIETR